MARVTMMTVALLALVGCAGEGGNPDLPGGNNGGQIPDPAEGLAYNDDCDGAEIDGEFYEVPGATSYWTGDFELIDAGDDRIEVEGQEVWHLFPNDTWKDANPDHAIRCELVATASGRIDTENTCPSCDYRVSLDLRPDREASNCHEEFYQAHENDLSGQVEYDVTLSCAGNGPCEATVAFASSGDTLGTGHASAGRLTYTSGRLCSFF